MRNEVDLFDDHPLAYQDENQLSQELADLSIKYQGLPEQQVMNDEFCHLLMSIFGGLK